MENYGRIYENSPNHTQNTDNLSDYDSNYRREDSFTLEGEKVSSRKEPKRPARVLIALIDKCPLALVQKMSPGSKRLKRNLKMPLILMCLCTGLCNGNSLTLIKVGGEVINSPEADASVLFILASLVAGLFCAFLLSCVVCRTD